MGLQEFPELLFKGGRRVGGLISPTLRPGRGCPRTEKDPQLAGLQEFPELLFKGGRRAGLESCSWGTRPAGARVLLGGDSSPARGGLARPGLESAAAGSESSSAGTRVRLEGDSPGRDSSPPRPGASPPRRGLESGSRGTRAARSERVLLGGDSSPARGGLARPGPGSFIKIPRARARTH